MIIIYFIIKQLAREFKGNFECLRQNTDIYITFSVPIKKEHDNGKTTTYKLKFIDSCRFVNALLSSLVDNLSGINIKKPENKFINTMKSMNDSLSSIVDNLSEINKKEHAKSMASSLLQPIDKVSEIDRKIAQIDKKEHDEFEHSMRSMINLLIQPINKISQIDKKIMKIDKKEEENNSVDTMRSIVSSLSQSIDKVSEINKKISYVSLIEKFHNTNQLCNKDLNKFDLLLRKGVYSDEYMDRWKKFKEDKLPDKESLYSELNNEHITDEDYTHAQKVCDTLILKILEIIMIFMYDQIQFNLQMYLKTLEKHV